MPISTARIVMSDGGGTKRKPMTYQQQSNVQTPDLVKAKSHQDTWKNNLKMLQQKTQPAATIVQTPAYSQQQSNVQTPDLVKAKSNQNSWENNLETLEQRTQTASAGATQTPAYTQQQSNVQTPDLVYAKSQPTWSDNVERVQQKAEVRKDAWALAEKMLEQDPLNDPLIYIPNFSNNERPFAAPISYVEDQNAFRTKAAAAGMNADSVLQQAYRAVNKTRTEQRNKAMAGVAETSPILGSLLSVLLMPADVIGATKMGVGALLGQTTDPNDPAFQSTNARKAMMDAAAGKIETQYGAQAAERYRKIMGVAETAYGVYLAAGGLSGAIDIGSSAATQYINLINSGVSPETAEKLVGAQALVDAVGETGVLDDAVGAAAKKFGLTDTLVELANKIPSGKQLVQSVEDRVNTALMRLGLDIDGWNLPQGQEKELVNLTEALNGYSDEELGKMAKEVRMDGTLEISSLPSVSSKGQISSEFEIGTRPTWQQSEEDALKMYPGYRKQVSFNANGDEVKYGTKGSVRPDLYKTGSSVEVKNYSLHGEKQAQALVKNVTTQYNQRKDMLPPDTQQIVWIDVRGQNVPRERLDWIQNQILSKTQMGMIVVYKVK